MTLLDRLSICRVLLLITYVVVKMAPIGTRTQFLSSQELCRLVHSRPGHLLHVVQCIYFALRLLHSITLTLDFTLEIQY